MGIMMRLNQISESSGKVYGCSQCGGRFTGPERAGGFSHCENHKGYRRVMDEAVERNCRICNNPIEAERLEVLPRTAVCSSHARTVGEVDPIKRDADALCAKSSATGRNGFAGADS